MAGYAAVFVQLSQIFEFLLGPLRGLLHLQSEILGCAVALLPASLKRFKQESLTESNRAAVCCRMKGNAGSPLEDSEKLVAIVVWRIANSEAIHVVGWISGLGTSTDFLVVAKACAVPEPSCPAQTPTPSLHHSNRHGRKV